MGKERGMKSDLVLLGAVGAVIALVVAYAMMGQGQKTSVTPSRKRTFDQTITDPVFGEAVLAADNPNPASQFATHNAAGLTEAFAHLTQGTKLEDATAEVASKFRKVVGVVDNIQHTFSITDEQRARLETQATDKALALARAAKEKATPAAKAAADAAQKAASIAAQKSVAAGKVVASKFATGAKNFFERVYNNTLQKKGSK